MDNKTGAGNRLARNTILLYIRTICVMFVSLYTSRIILNALGIDDFGIYNVVGGLVLMFSALSGSFTQAITRFITLELGKPDSNRLNTIFCTSINIQFIMSIGVAILSECIGIWFINNYMNITPERIYAAHWVLQCSIVTFILSNISVPFNAVILAHERMGAFAGISILDIFLKLIVAYALTVYEDDKLITYAFLLMMVSFIIRMVYGLYCKRNFEECRFHFIIDKDILKRMGRFAGWNLLGTSAGMLNTQGVNILMNMYFGVAVNAARGLAMQVDAAVRSFTSSFMVAIDPQITKAYAAGNMEYMKKLISNGAKFSSFLFIYLAVPIIMETPFILKKWLGDVPDYTIDFVRLVVAASYVDSVLGKSYWIAIMSAGDIRRYQIVISIVGFLVFPLSWLSFGLGYGPETSYYIYIVLYCFALFVRLYFVKSLLGIVYRVFLNSVLARIVPVILFSFLFPFCITYNMEEGWLKFIATCIVSIICTSFIVWMIGLDKDERTAVTKMVSNFTKNIGF